MQIVPSNMLPARDKKSLRDFLSGCRQAAQLKGRFQLASISLAVKHIAPLAVLQSIYEPDELHFYVERANSEEALAGAEAVVSMQCEGPERFAEVKAFAEDVLANTIVVGDLSEPFTGPHFFTAFTFEDSPVAGAFAASTVFVPRWQVSRSRGKYGAVANIRVDPDSDLDLLVERVWGAYEKFTSFDYDDSDIESLDTSPKVVQQSELAPGVYEQAVSGALSEIREGRYDKIVLARGVQLEADRPWEPLLTLEGLRERFSGCFTFSFGGGNGKSFIGASPERLLRIRDGRLLTEAIAGSAPRGTTAKDDARCARALLESDKDQNEHAYVRDSILRRLAAVGLEGHVDGPARILQLANVQHLQTLIQAEVSKEVHVMDVVAELHPTPAVGGTPRGDALPNIRRLEQIERGLFAGVVGWFNHLNEGEMIVGIRSALIDGHCANLYAGAGIVEGSVPELEANETKIKINALLNAFSNT